MVKTRKGGTDTSAKSATEVKQKEVETRKKINNSVFVPDTIQPNSEPSEDKSVLIWKPTSSLSDEELQNYITLAEENYGYNCEQALGLLMWVNHDIERAISKLSEQIPHHDEWSAKEKTMFEEAIKLFGPDFEIIMKFLPEKSRSSLVQYYYQWQTTEGYISYLDIQSRKLSEQIGSQCCSMDCETRKLANEEENKRRLEEFESLKLAFCKRKGTQKSLNEIGGKLDKDIDSVKDREYRLKKVCFKCKKPETPQDLYTNIDELILIADDNKYDASLRSMEREISALRKNVQNNKLLIQETKLKLFKSPDGFKDN